MIFYIVLWHLIVYSSSTVQSEFRVISRIKITFMRLVSRMICTNQASGNYLSVFYIENIITLL